MSIPCTGPISLSTIQTEFGGTAATSFSEYVGGGPYVAAGTTGNPDGVTPVVIPSTGPLAASNFRCSSALSDFQWMIVGAGGGGTAGVPDNVGGGGAGGGGGGFVTGTYTGSYSNFAVGVTVGIGGSMGYYSGGFGGDGTPTSISGSITASAGGGGKGGSAPGLWNPGTPPVVAGGTGGYPNGSKGANANDDAAGFTGTIGHLWGINGEYYGGGGGGGGDNPYYAPGGAGGGGSANGAVAATRGGGGGGGNEWSNGAPGANGMAIFSYLSSAQAFNGGVVTTTGSGANQRWYHTFTSDGFLTALSYNAVPFIFTQTISANTTNYNLKTAAAASGWNYVSPLIADITIAAGVVIGSSFASAYAFETGSSLLPGSSVSITNNGYILGKGGDGATGGYGSTWQQTGGGPGGPALRAQFPITITNNGTIAGGGGGGGSGADYGEAGGGGGGGGAGWTIGLGGQGGLSTGYYIISHGSAGASGTALTPGGGGGGGHTSIPGEFSSSESYGATGGSGGALGTTGGSGLAGNNYGGPGGAGGACTSGNANITWISAGTRLGALG